MKLDARSLFALLADPTRLHAVALLSLTGELCVCELVHALDVIQPKVSRHLAALRAAGVVVDRRDGQWVYYRISAALPDWAADIVRHAASAAAGERGFRKIASRLERMPDRPDERRCA